MPAPFVKSRVLHYDLLREIELDQDIEAELREACGDQDPDSLDSLYEGAVGSFTVGQIISGKIINITKDAVLVDIGYKSEGSINSHEFDEPGELDIGDQIEVLLEQVEDDSGMVVLSKRKADRIRGWEQIINEKGEGDKVTGKALRKIKGGLLVDIGVPVFLPASQVSIRSIGDIGQLIGQDLEAKIIKIDMERRNIVISRRKLIEEEREVMKNKIMSELEVGQVRSGQVKNITDFGAFVDLGGIDGLLHITDMSWGRISHPSEIVALDQSIEVVILDIDREREKISLGLKQKSASPWVAADEKYPVGSKHAGEVVNLMSYGAFVKLEDGIEGLVHISEMSWTRRINHPSEAVTIGDEVEVVVLGINMEKQEISLGMKQTDENPWDKIDERYPPGTRVSGRVRNLANYGAFVELEEGIDGLLHVSDISWTKKVTHPSEVLKK
ncbi:MAG: 30S ribosomal protein S1, partial [Planctomycetota bacterium]|nr:30S ribosomal protein S1 [Planctomycetota bacterium]